MRHVRLGEELLEEAKIFVRDAATLLNRHTSDRIFVRAECPLANTNAEFVRWKHSDG